MVGQGVAKQEEEGTGSGRGQGVAGLPDSTPVSQDSADAAIPWLDAESASTGVSMQGQLNESLLPQDSPSANVPRLPRPV